MAADEPVKTGEPVETPKPILSSLIPLSIFLLSWLFSLAVFPVAAYLSIGHGVHYVTYGLLFYYTYRMFFKLKRFDYVHKLQRDINRDRPYFRNQKAVLECGEIEPNSKSLLSWHPHGILCIGWILNGNVGPDLFDACFRWLTAPVLFRLPLLSEMLAWYKCGPATARYMKAKMKRGENVALLPGGFQEATLYTYGKHRVYIKRRKGFVKYALQHGYKIYPCYTFGEEKTYKQLLPGYINSFRLWLNKFHIPSVVFMGKHIIIPYNQVDLVSVVGKPLELPLIPNPTEEDVSKWHGLYVEALVDVFERNKRKYAADPESTLEVF